MTEGTIRSPALFQSPLVSVKGLQAHPGGPTLSLVPAWYPKCCQPSPLGPLALTHTHTHCDMPINPLKPNSSNCYTMPCRPISTIFTARACEGGLGSCNSVCPSVCLSATRVDCDKSKWCTADILKPHKEQSLCYWTSTVVGGRRSLPSEICVQSDRSHFEKRWLRQISAYNVSTVRDSEKVQLWRI